MSDNKDAASQTPSESGDPEPESPGRSSFLSKLFRRDEDRSEDAAATLDSIEAQAGQNAMLVNLRNMRRLRVDDVSIPRADIVAVPEDVTLQELVAVFKESTLSRLPVYRDTLDQPVGLVHLKDVALRFAFGTAADEIDLSELLRPLLYAPPSMPIGVLLQKMQAARIHMALVIDEYGGVDGLVTIEDLLEQIVGDIADEHDDEEALLWTCEAPGVYQVLARADLEDFEAEAGLKLAEPVLDEEVDSVGGLVFRLSGRVPARGEVVMHPAGHEFEVMDADARRIKRLRVRLSASGESPPAAEAAE